MVYSVANKAFNKGWITESKIFLLLLYHALMQVLYSVPTPSVDKWYLGIGFELSPDHPSDNLCIIYITLIS